MDGITVNGSQRFLDSGRIQENKISQLDISGSSSEATSGVSFSETLNAAIQNVNALQKTSDKGAQDLAAGRTDNVAEVMIASEKADIALRLMVQVRNKIIDAYQEIMKMQV
jgi:flagellar hook-basal body complex protein FliE